MKRAAPESPTHALPNLDALFSEHVLVATGPIEDHRAALHPAEREGIEQASEDRQREFSTGRWLAHALLDEPGAAAAPIPRNADRTPRWPAGRVGSITHSGGFCAVAIGRASARLRGVGVDLEPDLTTKPGLERMICFGEELDWIAEAGTLEAGRRCRVVFSAKEAVYKAFHPSTGRVWRFEEVALRVDLDRGSFRARLPADAGRAEIEGRIVRRGGWIVSGVEW